MASLSVHLHAIRAQHGDLTPELVVETASPPDHPLHSHFEWDDSVAGHKHRLHQASNLIRVVKLPPVKGEPLTLRAFVSIPQPDRARTSYVPTQEALADGFTRQLLLQDMEREWRVLRRRWQHMAEFAEMIQHDLGEPPQQKAG